MIFLRRIIDSLQTETNLKVFKNIFDLLTKLVKKQEIFENGYFFIESQLLDDLKLEKLLKTLLRNPSAQTSEFLKEIIHFINNLNQKDIDKSIIRSDSD